MEALKKTAVLISGLLIIILVTWILSLSSNKPEQKSEPQSPEYSDQTQSESEGDSRTVEVPETKKPSTEQDTIAWQTFSDVEQQNRKYTFSNQVPLSGNPNPVFISAAERILPAVVSIRSSRRIKHPSMDFFPHFFPKKDEEKEGNEEDGIIQPGSGSGIILSKDGYIMTNYHVVEESERIQVVLYDKREFEARMVGGDPATDVALLKIRKNRLPVAMMGNSDSVQIGEWVMAVGNPLNFTSTITSGIVSALGRNINIIDPKYRYRIENFIQTDAVINPGNSGGALINLSGEVIGINTAIATRNGFYQGYGFAIPINLARKVVNDLLRFGRVRRAILGVVIEPVTDNVAKAVGLSRPTGALIQNVTKDSPAERAGLHQGDIIMAVEDEEVVSVNDLQTKIAQHQPGETITIAVWRGRREMSIEIELGEAPPANKPVSQNQNTKDTKFENLGLSFRSLSEKEKKELNITQGLLVEKVASGSPAENAGFYSMLIVVSINDQPVSIVDDFKRILNQAKPGEFLRMSVKDSRFSGEGDSRILFVEVE